MWIQSLTIRNVFLVRALEFGASLPSPANVNAATSGVVDGQSVPSRAVSITGDLSLRRGHVGAEFANRDTSGEACPVSHDSDQESDRAEFQPPLGQLLDWTIPEDFVFGRPTTGQETAGSESWTIPEDFVFGRPTTGQETAGSESWTIPEDFVFGRPTTEQETTGSESWIIPEDFVFGRPTTEQETAESGSWLVPEEFLCGRPTTEYWQVHEGVPVSSYHIPV